MNTDFCLGGWIIRPQRDCIERGDESVHIKPKAMAVLVCLAEAAGNVVTRNDLFDAVWPGGTVTDDVLTQCIVELRKAFGDSARKQRIIETIPKVGFRLVKPVTPFSNEPTTTTLAGTSANGNDAWTPGNRIFLIITSTILMALVFFWYLTGSRDIQQAVASKETPSIAVLPFVDMSESQDQDWYSDGLTEDLINRLAQLEGLKVAGRTSSFKFKDNNEDLRIVGELLGVNHVLEGSVRRDKEQLRITAQLIETGSGFHAWSRQFNRPREDIFAVQDEIATSVANALSIELRVGDLGIDPAGTSNVEAYEEILLSKRYQWENTPDSVLLAIEHVKRAIEIDPDYARAWFHLAGMYVNAYSTVRFEDSPDWLELSLQALAHTRKLDPTLSGLDSLTAHIQMKKWQWPELEVTFSRGAGLDISTDVELLFAYCGFLGRVGRLHEALPLLERLRRIVPQSPGTAGSLAHMYAAQGRIEEALAEAERAFGIKGFRVNSINRGILIAMQTDDRNLLLKWLARAEDAFEPEPRRFVMAMRDFLNDRESALDFLRSMDMETGVSAILVAYWAAWHGDTGLALDAMRQVTVTWGFWDPLMKDVRPTPGFKDLVRHVGLEAYFREFGWNDFCYPVGEDDFECE